MVNRRADRRLASLILVFASAWPGTAQEEADPHFAATLSSSGFYASTADKRIAAEFVPYTVNSALWTDGASKDRFVRVPPGTQIRFHAEREWDFPPGTTFLQTLYLEPAPSEGAAPAAADAQAPDAEAPDAEARRLYLETRVIVIADDGSLRFASYAWNDEGSDAELVSEYGDDLYANHGDVSQLWSIAAREDCTKCHEGKTLGVSTDQILREVERADGSRQQQLTLFRDAGILAGLPEDLAGLAHLARVDPRDAAAPLEARVRSYLATNCSGCHHPGGAGSETMDLRLEIPLAETGMLRSRLVSRGKPMRSRLLGRMAAIDQNRMPPVISTVADEAALRMVHDWIAALPTRPPAGNDAPAAGGADSAKGTRSR